jgi:hypothetical protein
LGVEPAVKLVPLAFTQFDPGRMTLTRVPAQAGNSGDNSFARLLELGDRAPAGNTAVKSAFLNTETGAC